MKRGAPWIAVALVLVTNLLALLGVAWNRRGESESSIELTERELPLAHTGDEDSGTALRLDPSGLWDNDWLDRTRLEALGFDCSAPPHAEQAEFFYGKQLPRRGYLVLEYAGQAWQGWLEEQREWLRQTERDVDAGEVAPSVLDDRHSEFERQRLKRSRLFAVDAGRDPERLRRRYPASDRFVILPAVFRIGVERPWNPETGQQGPPVPRGRVEHVLVNRVHLSRQLAEPLAGLAPRTGTVGKLSQPEKFAPRYDVDFRVGRRYEPWISEVRLRSEPTGKTPR